MPTELMRQGVEEYGKPFDAPQIRWWDILKWSLVRRSAVPLDVRRQSRFAKMNQHAIVASVLTSFLIAPCAQSQSEVKSPRMMYAGAPNRKTRL